MIELYPQIKSVHIAAVLASGLLFLMRGAACSACFALKRGSMRRIRIACWIAALCVYGFIISVARAHNPAGLFAT